jgi:uncharacterized membrane protein
MNDDRAGGPGFPLSAGILLGLGLGGFFDGVVLHQILQWHHMLSSAGAARDTVEGLKLNTLADGLFHAATYAFTLAGLGVLWRTGRKRHIGWPGRLLPGSLLVGFGLFNLVEGLVNHHLLGLHHVNETAPVEQWVWYDLAFLASGAVMLAAGSAIIRSARGAPPQGGARN